MIDIAALQAPFAPHEHSWRAQQVARDGRKAMALCYITSRSVQNRLDAVCTPAGWESAFAETASGRVIATITIDLGARWVAKSDGAGATAMEGEKGGLSDAFKRAAVMWGIGRYLYGLSSVWAECEVLRDDKGDMRLKNGKPTWKRWTARGIDDLERALRELFNRMEGSPGAQAHRVAGRRAVELLPPPTKPDVPLSDAPPFKMPAVVTALIDGLPHAIRDGSADVFWREHYPKVPDVWQAFVVAEKDRIKREGGQ
jgi:hypothetical protein